MSARGWLLLFLAGAVISGSLILNIYPFLAETDRVNADVLVVEGWVHEFGVRLAVDEFKTGRYRHVFTTGGPQTGAANLRSDPTAADVIADWLHYRGIPNASLQPVPSYVIGRDRTYYSALALRDWCRTHRFPLRSINVVTETVHARRTRFLYQEAFGDRVEIGILAASNPDYDPKRWWRYSDGVRDVISETVAYVYARFFFHPPPKGSPVNG
jgi:DUF218 domain